MVAKTLEAQASTGQTGLTVSAYPIGTDTVATEVSAAAATEAANRLGWYTCTADDLAAGDYQVKILSSGGTLVASWMARIAAGAGTYQCHESLPDTIPTVQTVVDAIKTVTDLLPSSGALTDLPVNLTKVLGTALAETTGGRIAANLNTFWDNADAATAQTVDDVGAGAGGSATLAKQNEILSSLSGDTISVVANVTPGGTIILKQNDDHTIASSNTITLPFTDVGAVVHALTQVSGTTAKIGFRKKKGGAADDIVGTIDTGTITESADITTVVIEVPAANTASKVLGEYRYDVQIATTGGDITTLVSGPAVLQQDNAT